MNQDADFLAGLLAVSVFVFIAIFWLFWMSLVIGGLVFWIFMIVDVAKRDFPKPDDKTVWVLVVALAGILGALIYYFSIKRPAQKLAKIQPKT